LLIISNKRIEISAINNKEYDRYWVEDFFCLLKFWKHVRIILYKLHFKKKNQLVKYYKLFIRITLGFLIRNTKEFSNEQCLLYIKTDTYK